MIGDTTTRTTLRGLAIAIALAAMIDPAVTSNRSAKPDVVVLASDSVRDADLANDIARRIGKNYTVARGTVSGASATIVAGPLLSRVSPYDEALNINAPIFAVASKPERPNVDIEIFDVPPAAPTLARVRTSAVVHVANARGKTVELSLRDDAVSLAQVTRRVATNDDTVFVPLSFVPTQAAPRPLHLVVHVDGAVDAVADAFIDVREQKWAVLFYDPRPSWMSTFVRRSIERDPRFVTTARVVTSRDLTTSTGTPPGRLDDLAALSLFDVVVIGAPQALTSNDVAGVEAFMRRRGGNVVLLLDEPPTGPVERLIDVAGWRSVAGNQPVTLITADSLALQAASIIWPAALPTASEVVASNDRPVVWREPVGGGSLLISGALDAWRFRDLASSSFERFWQTTIGDAANRTPPPLSIRVSNNVLDPGEWLNIAATLRNEAIDAGATGPLQFRATMTADPDSARALHLWPRDVGEFGGLVRAPRSPGPHRIIVSVGGRTAEVPILVKDAPNRPTRGTEGKLVDIVRASHGAMLSASQIDRLSTLLAEAIHVEPRAVTWHPMRSAWWIIPFVLALSGEWWLRRRRGLP